MNLRIKPWSKNTYPLQGILIKGTDLKHWLGQLQILEIDINEVPVFAIPDTSPNSIWGCFVAMNMKQFISNDFKQHNIQFCQCINETLFIPEYSTLYPKINPSEIAIHFAKNRHIFHPEFGLFELENPIDWQDVLEIPLLQNYMITEPHITAFRPQSIHKIEIKALPPEELLKNMEESMFPKKETFNDKPLNWKEKIKYQLLKTVFKTSETRDGAKQTEKTNWVTTMALMLSQFIPTDGKLFEKFENEFEDLEKRNRSEMEKLMQLFKSNPEEALKYAIPIDNEGTNRGGDKGTFSMSQRWKSFNLFGNSGVNSSGNVLLQDDSMAKLQQQYYQAATNFVNEKNFEKAAFVYMKLLKNNQMAANTLEEGKLYPEAAALYLKYMNNKERAASCYEKGRMISDAIELYKELKMDEKVGDLYQSINKRKEAFVHYNYVVENYKTTDQYVKASLLLRYKMEDKSSAQDILIAGWREQKDSFNCINNYFANIEDVQILSKEIDSIYRNETNERNKPEFLKALKYEHKKDALIAAQTKELAYEIVSELASSNPSILNELSAFIEDTQLSKDITRYKMKVKLQRNI
jgi:tetratricopeptide (TPR) repeat protein